MLKNKLYNVYHTDICDTWLYERHFNIPTELCSALKEWNKTDKLNISCQIYRYYLDFCFLPIKEASEYYGNTGLFIICYKYKNSIYPLYYDFFDYNQTNLYATFDMLKKELLNKVK
jgi:hypothetical protein